MDTKAKIEFVTVPEDEPFALDWHDEVLDVRRGEMWTDDPDEGYKDVLHLTVLRRGA